MGFADFIKNGGLIGAARGFNHKQEGRNYQLSDLSVDIKAIKTIIGDTKKIGTSANKMIMENNSERLLES